MTPEQPSNRREFLRGAGCAASAVAATCLANRTATAAPTQQGGRRGAQRLTVERLKQFEALRYGMFISYDVQAFVPYEVRHSKRLTDEQRLLSPTVYAPDRLDVGQWIAVARDAGMKYAVLTAERHPGFCLWPSKHTNYTVANSGNKTDVVAKFVEACAKCGVQPGLYYPSVDIYHCFGRPPQDDWKYVTSGYQTFQTNQITELLTDYGAIAEVWIDIPSVLGRGYRTYLYDHIARLQPNSVIMMNAGIQDGTDLDSRLERFWPTDLIAIEKRLPPDGGYQPWRTIEGKEHYLPGEVCDSIMRTSWCWKEGDTPRDDQELLAQFQACRQRGVNFLLDAPPDNHGLIPQSTVESLMRLRRNAAI